MSDKTKISWAQATVNWARGCQKVSDGCKSCYAIGQVAGLARKMGGVNPEAAAKFEGLVKDGNWTGVVRIDEKAMTQPLRWQKGRRIFVNSLGDTFHDSISDLDLLRFFEVVRQARRHTFLVLTKRPERMKSFCERLRFDSGDGRERRGGLWLVGGPYPEGTQQLPGEDQLRGFSNGGGRYGFTMVMKNLWLGVTAENQATADERIPLLVQTPAAVRFLSCEPLLSAIDLSKWLVTSPPEEKSSTREGWPFSGASQDPKGPLSWIIAGGESGSRFRPMDLDWARSLRDQCVASGTAYFFKQSSATKPGQGDTLDGVAWRQFPDDGQRRGE